MANYIVHVSRKATKRLRKLPVEIVERFSILTRVLEKAGPTGPHMFRNYSRLSETEYHCHLSYSYVACWRHEKKTVIVEVCYVGSREDAPY